MIAQVSVEPVLDARACAALVAYIDKHAPQRTNSETPLFDTKLKISMAELKQVIGQQVILIHGRLRPSPTYI
jgi:hypothetical protein